MYNYNAEKYGGTIVQLDYCLCYKENNLLINDDTVGPSHILSNLNFGLFGGQDMNHSTD